MDQINIIKQSVWTFANMCKTKPLPDWIYLNDILQSFIRIFENDKLWTNLIEAENQWKKRKFS